MTEYRGYVDLPRERFRVNDRVEFGPGYYEGRRGIVRGFGRDGKSVRVQLDGSKSVGRWDADVLRRIDDDDRARSDGGA